MMTFLERDNWSYQSVLWNKEGAILLANMKISNTTNHALSEAEGAHTSQ